jgi:hypothetical protein
VYLNGAVILDKPKFAEAIHKEVDARAGGANHFRQHFLAYFGDDGIRSLFLAKVGEQQKDPGETFFAGIEKLIDQVFLHPGVTGQRIISFLSILRRAHGVMAEALATRTGWAWAMHSSPQKSPGASNAIVASLPVRAITLSLIRPLWM